MCVFRYVYCVWMLETMLVSSILSQGLLTERILSLTSLATEPVLGVSCLYLSHPWGALALDLWTLSHIFSI